ncbi:MAG: MFS transporter [Thermodesulfobacteriota bacterium]|jgi:EmrB/QacA subfamily drug resistance transporter
MDAISDDHAGTKRFVLFVTTLAAFLSPFGISSVNIALPSIGQEFLMDAILLSWVTTAYLLTSAMFPVPFGKIADIYGRKRIFTYGTLTFTLASIGSAISNSVAMLICFRILQGIGAAATYCVGAAILTSVFPSRELGKVFGINLAAVYIGYSVGPFLGGFLTHHLGWRSIFLVNVLLGLIIIFFIFWKLKGEWHEAKEEKFDLIGSIIYSITLLFILYGFSQMSTMRGIWLMLLGALGIFTFIKWETKVESPVLDINLFRNNRVFALSNLAALINYSATFAVTFLLSLYLQYIKELTAVNAGLILVSQPIVQAFFSPFAGRFSDRIEPGIVASIGMALTAVGLFLFIFLNEKTTLEFIVAILILLGFGFALFSSPNTNAVMSSVENRFYGVASGTLGTMRMMGMALSMGITILIFSVYIGKVRITPEYYPLFLRCTKMAFTFFTVLCLGGTFASLARGKVR